ncbi:glycerate kinase [Lasiosphaeris hirsuta]|uniref:Glycerate kinase n=1 Tax=Lasiosphaeris hirsuta TaxID=260670 RepID=A0AA40E028_9PEZI|nr:glycerate kinase [Lasiosphaeris hirsuta]
MSSLEKTPPTSPVVMPSTGTPLRILVAPSNFKESAGAAQVADWIEEGFRTVNADTKTLEIYKFPLHDGEGFTQALVELDDGSLFSSIVRGPTGKELIAPWGLIDNRATGVMDVASAAGLRYIPQCERNPLTTSSFGVGQLLRAVIKSGCKKIIIACGDSGTSDAGVGLLAALGVVFLDASGDKLDATSGARVLSSIHEIVWPSPDSDPIFRLIHEMEIEVVGNLKNYLIGNKGVARVYGPQKGATPKQVELLAKGIENFASILNREPNHVYKPGSGASGGIGVALYLLGARMYGRCESFARYFNLETVLLSKRWHVAITGEGQLDENSDGKATVEFARLAKARGIPVVCLVGARNTGNKRDGGHDCINWVQSIINREMTTQTAMSMVEELVKDASADIMRALQVGINVGSVWKP